MIEAYKAEYETTNITLEALLEKYELTKEELPGHETWIAYNSKPAKPRKTKTQKKTDTILAQAAQSEIVTPTIVTPILLPKPAGILPETSVTETQLAKIANFKELALDHCIKFMSQDAKFAEVKEFKDIVAIVDSLEKSYQKVDPEAGKPTINIMINNLMERFKDDC